ncbi:MAG: MFS transporter [Methylococcales bacterium]|nr:MFS transporter [Methylococcales bacterium]
MTALEKRATLSLSSIYALRMLGLFMLFPVLSLYTEKMEGATPFLIGLAIGIYGLTQAIMQIPFGLLSDRVGRKKIIVLGLIIFAAGSVVAALSTTIYGILAGRAIQGGGAIAAAIMALVADSTQEVHRTKAMATIGASIGVSFGVAIVVGPIIAGYIGVSGIFWLTGALALLAILVVLFIVPNPKKSVVHPDAEVVPGQFFKVLKNPDLLRLDYGIFILHSCLTASFVVIPFLIRDAGVDIESHWKIYLPILVSSMAVIVPFVIIAETKRKMKIVFVGAIITLMLANLGFLFYNDLYSLIGFFWLFFCGFNLLEATLPSLISKTAPGDLKGTAMGAYSSSQFMGAFVGSSVGGWLYGEMGAEAVFYLCACATGSWAIVALSMNPPNYLANMLLSLEEIDEENGKKFVSELLDVVGIEEVTPHFVERVVYLKVDNKQLQKDDLQNLINDWSKL